MGSWEHMTAWHSMAGHTWQQASQDAALRQRAASPCRHGAAALQVAGLRCLAQHNRGKRSLAGYGSEA